MFWSCVPKPPRNKRRLERCHLLVDYISSISAKRIVLYHYSCCNEDDTVVVHEKSPIIHAEWKAPLPAWQVSWQLPFPPVFFKLHPGNVHTLEEKNLFGMHHVSLPSGEFLGCAGNQIPSQLEGNSKLPWDDSHMRMFPPSLESEYRKFTTKKSSIPEVGDSTQNILCLYCIKI